VNADKIAVTGNKLDGKLYRSHSGFLGGLKEISLGKLMVKKPTEAVKKSIYGMLPKNKLRKNMMLRLKLVAGTEHNF
jgi:large subunit ribosomal protein L13